MEEIILLYIFILMIVFALSAEKSLQSNVYSERSNTSRILTRRKRYLIFPEGSSLQLVYCLTVPAVGYPNIFTLGGTAALAWELPHDSYAPHRRPAEVLHRVDKPGDSASGGWLVQEKNTNPNHTSENMKPSLSTYSTIKRPMYNKIYGKNSPIHTSPAYREYLKRKYIYDQLKKAYMSSKNYKNVQKKSYRHPVYDEIHRRTRRDLFSKIEKFLIAQSKDGKACLLKAICEIIQVNSTHKGTFMEEILKTIFRTKADEALEDIDEYDKSANKSHNCDDKYPTCTSSIWKIF